MSPEKARVAYLEALDSTAESAARDLLPPGLELVCLKNSTYQDAIQSLRGARAAIVATFPITNELLGQAPDLRFIQAQGVGLDNFDIVAIREHSIAFALNPIGSGAVAEHAILLMLAVFRRLTEADRHLKMGGWDRWSLRTSSHSLEGKTVGILGFGRNGREVAKRLRGFGCKLLYYDNAINKSPWLGATWVDADEILVSADVLTLHLPLTGDTYLWLDENRLNAMKRGAIVVNTSRGDLVDESALAMAIERQHLAGAGLDVFSTEPPDRENPLIHCKNVVVTPHIAGGTVEVYADKLAFCYSNILRYLQGEKVRHLV